MYTNEYYTAFDTFLDRIAGTGHNIGKDGTYEADLNVTFPNGIAIHGTVTVDVRGDYPVKLLNLDPTETYLDGWGENLIWGGWSDAVAAAYLSTDKGLEAIATYGSCFEPV